MEVRFWQQSNRLIQAEPVYATARKRAAQQGKTFRCAMLFWWFNQGEPSILGDAQAALWGGRQQGVRCAELSRSVVRAAGGETGGLSLSELLGADGGVAMHAVDSRFRCRCSWLMGGPPRLNARYFAPSGLRSAKAGARSMRLERTGRRAGRCLCAVLDASKKAGPRCGSSTSIPTCRSISRSISTASFGKRDCSPPVPGRSANSWRRMAAPRCRLRSSAFRMFT